MSKKYVLYVFSNINLGLIFRTEDIVNGMIYFKDLYMSGCDIDFVILPSDLSFREWKGAFYDL